ncbi:MAG TPA: hypothetical protein VF208_13365 [Candidatus Binatia bacterium]
MKIQSVALMFLLTVPSLALAQGANPDLIAQAKKEGRVTWYTTVSIPESKLFIDMFEKQYPFIKVDLLRSGAGALINRVTSEYAARLFFDHLFSRPAQLKLRELSRIPTRNDVDADPPRLNKGFKRIVQDLENENMAESIKLFQQTFGLAPG